MCIKEAADNTLITIFVKPNSPKFAIEIKDNEIIVYATEEPRQGKVNKEILKELTRLFHTRVELVSGATSKQKTVSVGIKKAAVEQLLKKDSVL
jgi:uncharacterized protein (TIGR00251 family)